MPFRVGGVVFVIVVTIATLAQFDFVLSVIGLVVLILAGSEVFFPSQYTLCDEEGVVFNNFIRRRRQPWRTFQGWTATSEGYVLNGSGRAAILRRRRTIVLRCPECSAKVEPFLIRNISNSVKTK